MFMDMKFTEEKHEEGNMADEKLENGQ